MTRQRRLTRESTVGAAIRHRSPFVEELLEVELAPLQCLQVLRAAFHALPENSGERIALLRVEDMDLRCEGYSVQVFVHPDDLARQPLERLETEQPRPALGIFRVKRTQHDLPEPGKARDLVEEPDVELLALLVLRELVSQPPDIRELDFLHPGFRTPP